MKTSLAEVDAGATPGAGDVFGLNKVVGLHIEMPADEYQAMQPPIPAGGFGRPPQGSPSKKAGARASERNLFGIEFPWARGSLTARGRTYNGVGFRYAGNASYMASAGGLKRSFKVELDGADHPGLSGPAQSISRAARSTRRRPAKFWRTRFSARPAFPRLARRLPK